MFCCGWLHVMPFSMILCCPCLWLLTWAIVHMTMKVQVIMWAVVHAFYDRYDFLSYCPCLWCIFMSSVLAYDVLYFIMSWCTCMMLFSVNLSSVYFLIVYIDGSRRKEAHAYYVLIVTAMYVFIMSRRVGQPYRYRIGYVLMWGYRVCKHALREESPFLRYVACLGRETC